MLSCPEMTSSHPHLLVKRGSYWGQRPYLPLLGPWSLLLQPLEGRHCSHVARGHSIHVLFVFQKENIYYLSFSSLEIP